MSPKQFKRYIAKRIRLAEREGYSHTRSFQEWLDYAYAQLQAVRRDVWASSDLRGLSVPLIPTEVY